MDKITKKAVAKVAAVATGLGMATSLLSLAPMAHAAALTSTQIESIISLLESFGADTATVANVRTSLTGGTPTGGTTGTMASACAFTMDLHTGSSGAQVTCLQNALIAAGYSIPAGATGYFGSQTQAAVAAWQTAAGVSPPAGYFGPISRAAFNLGGTPTPGTLPAGCTSTTGYSSTTGLPCSSTPTPTPTTLTGNGRFTNESSLGDVTSDLHTGDGATAVVGDSFDATDGDVQLQRVDATFDLSAVTTGSTNLDKYVTDVQLWLGDTKLASMDASDGDKASNVWTFRFSGLNAIIKKDDTAKIYVKVVPVSSVGANEDAGSSFAGTMNAKMLADSVRAIGGDGISDTYVATAISQSFTVSSATTGTLTASPASDNPVAAAVATASSTVTGVKLLSFNLKAKNSAAELTDLRISLNTSDNNLNDVVNTVYLKKGSDVLKSATLSTGSNGVVTFTNIDETISKDATENYTIVVDLKGQNTAYVDGTTIIASTTVAGWDVSDSDGNSINPSAAVAGNTQTLTGSGISVVMGTPTATKSDGGQGGIDNATFTIPFTVTAGDTAVWVGGKASATTTTASATTGFGSAKGVVYATTTTSSTGATSTPSASVSASGTDSNDVNTATTGGFYIGANSSRTFTLTVAVACSSSCVPDTAYEYGFVLVGINYDTANAMASTYYTSNITTFKTSDVFLYKHS
jgi:hypothetical protein